MVSKAEPVVQTQSAQPQYVEAPFSACHATPQPSTKQIAHETAFLQQNNGNQTAVVHHKSGVPHMVELNAQPQSAGQGPGTDVDMSKPYSPPSAEVPHRKVAAGAGPPLPPPNSGQGLISCPHFPLSTSRMPPLLPTDVAEPIYNYEWQDVQHGVTWCNMVVTWS